MSLVFRAPVGPAAPLGQWVGERLPPAQVKHCLVAKEEWTQTGETGAGTPGLVIPSFGRSSKYPSTPLEQHGGPLALWGLLRREGLCAESLSVCR